jgi:ferrochelatase
MQNKRKAVLLVNLGTPQQATAEAVAKFLRPFLGDQRVVEIPRLLWWPILNFIVIPLRAKRVAAAYAEIWYEQGSPLEVITREQVEKLRKSLPEDIRLEYAMSYSEPGIAEQMNKLLEEGVEHVFVLPLYPQYSATTTASVFDQIACYLQSQRKLPGVTLLSDFHDHPLYIKALAASVRASWEENGRAQQLIMSFHGIPQANVDKGDPYQQQCEKTASLLAAELGLSQQQWQICYQSRFGKAKWIEPYTIDVLERSAQEGKSVDVICPAFVADCLETLEEMNVENRNIFLDAGGNTYNFIPCLNAGDAFIDCLRALIQGE